MDVPNSGAIFTLGKAHLAENTQSYFYIKNDPIKRLISGPNQSAVICESGRLFVWGENRHGQLGIGGGSGHTATSNDNQKNNNNNNSNNEIVTKPTCVRSLKTLGLKIADIAYGNDWAIILTYSNELFFSGRNVFPEKANISRNFMEANIGGERCAIIRKPFRIEEFDAFLSNNEEAENYLTVLAGNEHFVAMTSFGRLIGWGSNHSFQLGRQNHSSAIRVIDGHNIRLNDSEVLRDQNEELLQPLEIVLDSPIQQFTCGPESTLVLTESGNLYLTGRLNEFTFPDFVLLQQNLSPTEQIIFMHISKASEIFIVTNAGSIYRSIESMRNKNLIFQRFYDYDSEENGPIWKLLKGLSFYSVLTKANKFYTTFSESGHHLKTFREISKFKNLRLLDMAVGDQHILVHGIPRSSTLSATIGPGGERRFMSRTYVMPSATSVPANSIGNAVTNGVVAASMAEKDNNQEPISVKEPDTKKADDNNITATVSKDNNNKESTNDEEKLPLNNSHPHADNQQDAEHLDDNENSMETQNTEMPVYSSSLNVNNININSNNNTNGISEDNEGKAAANIEANKIEPNRSGSPTESVKSRKSNRSIKFNASEVTERTPMTSSNERLLRPRTPYPESSGASTPQTVKKTPLRNYSYEAAMNNELLDRTSPPPTLSESPENAPGSFDSEGKKSPNNEINKKTQAAAVTAIVSSPTPPTEEDEQLTVEINTTTDALDRTVVVNEIRFINNGVDVTANVKQNATDAEDTEDDLDNEDEMMTREAGKLTTQVNNLGQHLNDDVDEVRKEAEGILNKLEEDIVERVEKANELKTELKTNAQEAHKEFSGKIENEVEKINENVETAATNTARSAMDAVSNNLKRVTTGAKHTMEDMGQGVWKMADNTRYAVDSAIEKVANETKQARNAMDSMGDNLKRVGTDAKHTMEDMGQGVMNAAGNTKNAVGNAFGKVASGTKQAVDAVGSKISNEVQEAKENISDLLHIGSKSQRNTTTNEHLDDDDDRDGDTSKDNTGADDERTTASVNSNQTSSAGNPFESENPFEEISPDARNRRNSAGISRNPFEEALTPETKKQNLQNSITTLAHTNVETEKQRGNRIQQFLDDLRVKSNSISCRNEKSIRVEDEPPHYSISPQMDTTTNETTGRRTEVSVNNEPSTTATKQNHKNTSKVCVIL